MLSLSRRPLRASAWALPRHTRAGSRRVLCAKAASEKLTGPMRNLINHLNTQRQRIDMNRLVQRGTGLACPRRRIHAGATAAREGVPDRRAPRCPERQAIGHDSREDLCLLVRCRPAVFHGRPLGATAALGRWIGRGQTCAGSRPTVDLGIGRIRRRARNQRGRSTAHRCAGFR